MQASTRHRVDVQCLKLLDADQTEQAVSRDQAVVQEPERAFSIHGDQPQRQLRHLDRERVDVHSVQAVLGDQATGVQLDLLGLGVRADAVAFPVLLARDCIGAAFSLPGLHQLVGQVAAGCDEEGAGAHRDVGDLQLQDF